MMNSLRRLTIAGFVIGGLVLVFSVFATNDAPQPATLLAAASSTAACDCSNLAALQIELRNALVLQQRFQGKIDDLRKLERDPSSSEFKKFAASAANGLKRPPGDTGPEAVDYTPYGETVDTGILEKEKETPERHEQLCGLSRNAQQDMFDMEKGASCAGIVQAVKAHEAVHWASCRRSGFVAFRDMHGADRAQEEVEAYGAQIKVLREIINGLRCGYRATGQDGPVVYSGVICSLAEPFTVTGTHPMFTFPFKFVPSSPTAGMMTYGTSGSGIAAAGGGPYVIEGADTDTPRIVVNTRSTASSAAATTSGGGTATIKLVPLNNSGECPPNQPR
jgi:hypothetical protein